MSRRKKKNHLSDKRIAFFITAAVISLLVWILPGISDEFAKYFTFYDDSVNITPTDGELSVHYIDVGQGDSELIIAPDGEAMLIDAGTSESKTYLTEYLRRCKITEIKYFVLTHPHSDHIGGASAILDAFEVKNVIMPDAISTTSTYKKVLEKIDAEGCGFITAEPNGEKYSLGTAEFKILGPVKDYTDNLNNQSAVIRLDYGQTSFLFTGDAESQSEADMLNRFPASYFKADVLKLGHHGSSTSTSGDWLSAVSPAYAIISCGKDNDYGHPHSEILNLLKKNNIAFFRTDRSGSIVIVSDGEAVSVLSPS